MFLKLYADDKLLKTESQKPAADRSYALTAKLKAGIDQVQSRVRRQDRRQRNGVANRTQSRLRRCLHHRRPVQCRSHRAQQWTGRKTRSRPVNQWIRSYGNQLEGTTRGGWGNAVRTHIWGKPELWLPSNRRLGHGAGHEPGGQAPHSHLHHQWRLWGHADLATPGRIRPITSTPAASSTATPTRFTVACSRA